MNTGTTELTFEEMQKVAGADFSRAWHEALEQLKKKYNEDNLYLLYMKTTEEEKAWLRSLKYKN